MKNFKIIALFLTIFICSCRFPSMFDSEAPIPAKNLPGIPSETTPGTLAFPGRYVVSSTNFLNADQTGLVSNGNNMGRPIITSNGRFVTFTSNATNFPNGLTDGSEGVYIRDISNSASPIYLVSSNNSTLADQSVVGGSAQDRSEATNDGRYVVFVSSDVKFMTGANGSSQIYRKDMSHPELPPAIVSSLDSTQNDQTLFQGNTDSRSPSLSADGRYVIFSSDATNFVTGATNTQIYLKDMNHPELPPKIVSTLDMNQADQTNFQATGGCHNLPKISKDAKYAVIACESSNFVDGDPNNQVYVKDLTQPTLAPKIVSSMNSNLFPQSLLKGNAENSWHGISSDGRFIAFESEATNFYTGLTGSRQLYLKDMNYPERAPVIISSLNSLMADQTLYLGDANSSEPEITDDGRFVFFESEATNFATGVSSTQTYRKDMLHPELPPMIISSLDPGQADQTNYCSNANARGVHISADGKSAVFSYEGSNFFVGSVPGAVQIFKVDLSGL